MAARNFCGQNESNIATALRPEIMPAAKAVAVGIYNIQKGKKDSTGEANVIKAWG
jgi:hypothetical protein